MLAVRLLPRGNLSQYTTTTQRLHTTTLLYDSSDSSSSDSDKKRTKRKLKAAKTAVNEEQRILDQQQTTNRLNSLLETMMKKPNVATTLDFSMPIKKPKAKTEQKKKSYEESLISAAQTVATTLGGDVQKTEADLLKKLLSTKKGTTEKEHENEQTTPLSLSDMLAGMKIERTPEASRTSILQKSVQARAVAREFGFIKSKFDQTSSNSRTQTSGRSTDSATLYDGTRLHIFKNTATKSPDIPKLVTWETLQNKEFKLALTHPPENIFQEMILWTEQGKLWKFPIDNEQGMEEEHSVHFSEHVFMERHLKDWCPKRGPIRHFMELVCVGLSKNPYMTVKEKTEHLAWYREYFAAKEELLKELGAVEGNITPQTKQIEA